MAMIFQQARSRLIKIGIRRKYNWVEPPYLYPECEDFHMEIIFQGARSALLKIGIRKKYNWSGPENL